jgi:circadian clock protein KaiB
VKSATGETVPYRLTLFVFGDEANSVAAEENLRHICAEHLLQGTCSIAIVNIRNDYQAALDNDILVVPTLIVEGPQGISRILGDLSDIDGVVLALGCNR